MTHILLIDASGFAHRAYHQSGAGGFRSDGLPTWAVTGFMGLMWHLLGAAQADPADYAAAVFDHPGRTFRHKLFAAYKAQRPARDMELTAQLPWMKNAAEAMGITPVEAEGFEGDDVLATIATSAAAYGWRVTVVSSDKDLLQLVQDGRIEVVDPMSKMRVLEADVRGERFGVAPAKVPEVQALAGDTVDNIPGIGGVGIKTAAGLIRLFGTIEGVVEAANARDHRMTAGLRIALRGKLEDLQLYRRLATLDRNVDLGGLTLESLALRPVMREHVEKILKTLEASHKFDQIFGEAKTGHVVEALSPEAAFEWHEEELLFPSQTIPEAPQCGFYERRLVQGGPFVPVAIYREPERCPVTGNQTGKEVLRCSVGGRASDPMREWPKVCRRPVTRQHFDFETADASWAREFSPQEPKANPSLKIDPKTAPLPQFEKRGRNGKRNRRDRAQPRSHHTAD